MFQPLSNPSANYKSLQIPPGHVTSSRTTPLKFHILPFLHSAMNCLTYVPSTVVPSFHDVSFYYFKKKSFYYCSSVFSYYSIKSVHLVISMSNYRCCLFKYIMLALLTFHFLFIATFIFSHNSYLTWFEFIISD